MELKLYDTLTRDKRVFTPLDPLHVRMYVCGPTVYDFAHIGNARPVIVFDVLYRLLRHLYGDKHVTYVRNITDVDDKINARAAERNIPIRELTDETYKNFKADVEALGCLPPTIEPRATEHIEEMKALIERLVKSGHAYVAEDNVLFNVPSMPDYGKLSGRPLDEMIAGARVEVAPYKKDPQDFVLWKPSKAGEPGWPSPAGIKGQGRPGWHIECSAMAWKHLGETFDIHGGGIDLVFPHHENEIAQSRCAFHTGVMANYWMHNGFLQVEGEKMSKSLGNFFTIHELLGEKSFGGRSWQGEVLRLAMLTTHYTQPIDWTVQLVKETQLTWEAWKKLVAEVDFRKSSISPDEKIIAALQDDLNTPLVMTRLHQIAKEAQQEESKKDILYDSLVFLGLLPDGFSLAQNLTEKVRRDFSIHVPGLRIKVEVYAPKIEAFVLESLPLAANVTATIHAVSSLLIGNSHGSSLLAEWTKYNPNYISPRDIFFVESVIGIKKLNQSIDARQKARAERDFKESDSIRDKLLNLGIVVKDTQGRPTWEVSGDAKIEQGFLPRLLRLSWMQTPIAQLVIELANRAALLLKVLVR